MFQSARIKLTAWYLAIIMTVSILFSLLVLNRFRRELRRPFPFPPNPQIFLEIRQRLAVTLVFINGAIFFLAGGLGYVLAGKTLQPIQEMVEAQNRFISDASHELKTPLTSLKTAFEVYLRKKKSTIIKESLAEVNKLQVLTEGLLQLSYDQPIVLVPVALAVVVYQAVKRIQPLAQVKKISLSVAKTKLKILGNQEQLVELLVILLDNAVKYSPAGSRIKLGVNRVDKKAIVTVADNGIGISRKDLPHIFDRFYRADAARARTGRGGYSLGLAIAKKIVAAHRGSIKVASRLGKGTVFQLTFSLIN
jgi:signal transduction histidine kinase